MRWFVRVLTISSLNGFHSAARSGELAIIDLM